MARTKRFQCTLLTPLGAAFDADAVSVTLPAVDGQLGVLSGRAPLIALLARGLMQITQLDGTRFGFNVFGGFAEMRDNRLTVLSEQAERAFVHAPEGEAGKH